VRSGSSALPAAALVLAGLEAAGRDASGWRGSAGFDPLTTLAVRGRLPLSLGRAWDETAVLTRWALASAAGLLTLEVDAAAWADAGASPVQELAFSLALGAETLRALERRELAPAAVAPRLRLRLSVGPRLLLETAKLRAARVLWARLLEVCSLEPGARRVWLHAVSARWSRTLFDPHVNVLRGSFEALAAVLGGCDSLHVAPWDSELGPPSEPARRLARNTQLVLREESHLDRVADPLGGAWSTEVLTRQLAEAAWALLQQIESEGGMTAALLAGTPQGLVADHARVREQRLADGRDALVGTTRYANAAEQAPALRRSDAAGLRDAAVARLAEARAPAADVLAALDAVAAAPDTERLQALLVAARLGATLGELTKALRSGDEDPPRVAALRSRGAAAAFEDLRRDLLSWSGRRPGSPPVVLARLGPTRDHAASLEQARGFFAISGLGTGERREDEVERLAKAAAAAGAPVVVLVAGAERLPDAVPSFAGTVRAERPESWLAIVGVPDDAAEREAWRAAGVDAFIDPSMDVPRQLGELARRLGARP
jgi:methylmalonyl-CoA mutase